jgi:hypothetical protein
MPIGAGTFRPNARFAFPRSFHRGIVFDIAGYSVTHIANTYHWTKLTDPNEVWTIRLDPRYYIWSSNRWTLDFIVIDFFYEVAPDPTQHAQPFVLEDWVYAAKKSPYLLFKWADVDFGEFHHIDFPSAPPGYWSPPWLP